MAITALSYAWLQLLPSLPNSKQSLEVPETRGLLVQVQNLVEVGQLPPCLSFLHKEFQEWAWKKTIKAFI